MASFAFIQQHNLTEEQKKDLAEAYKINQKNHSFRPVDIFDNLTPSEWKIDNDMVEYNW